MRAGQLLRMVPAWLLACALSPVAAQRLPQFDDVPLLLRGGHYAALESRYPVDVGADASGALTEPLGIRFLQHTAIGLSEDDWPQDDKATRGWLESSPRSVPAQLVRVYALGRTVSRRDAAGDWAWVETALREQELLLLATRTSAAKDIVWHLLYVQFGSKEGWPRERIRTAVEAGLDAYPGSRSFHLAAAGALTSDWRGSAAPLDWLARQAASRLAPPQDAALYASARLWTAKFIESVYLWPFEAGLIDWKLMNVGMAQLQRSNPSFDTLNEHAALACRARDKAVTAALLGRIGSDVVPDVWKRWGGVSHYENCRRWAEAGALKS